jgi:hypothetical protein
VETYKEYALWGIPANAQEETLLLAKVDGEFITTHSDAEKYKAVLENKYGCKSVRIQMLDGSLPDFSKGIKS